MSWLPRVYPLTDRSLAGMSHPEQVAQLVEGGATLIQLREKTLPSRQFYEQASSALQLARKRGVKIVINDRVDLALILGADGVHLGQDDLPPELARHLLGPEAIVGYSTHSIDQAKRAAMLPISYLAIGPVFSTKTKSDTAPEVGLAGVRAVKEIAGNLPVVAIGGITEARIPEILAAGADSVAVISAVLSDPAQIQGTIRRLASLAKQI
jgi:thiamine-phosphate pyrophosphorylase